MKTCFTPQWRTRLFVSLGLAFILFVLMPAKTCLAQTNSGMVVGRVHDASNRAIGDALVKFVNEQTGNARSVRTDANGYFSVPNLRSGIYRITASKNGFFSQTYERFPVQITIKNELKMPEVTLKQASINGHVTDRAGNALNGAKVIASGVRERVTGRAMTNNSGGYTITDLPPGPYIITAAWNDERNHGVASVSLSLDEEKTDVPAIKLREVLRSSFDSGSQAQTVGQVDSGERAVSVVHTIDVARISNFSGSLFDSLPVGGGNPMRSFDEFAQLAPGVAPPPYTPGARGPSVGFGVGTAGQFAVNGMRARSNNFSVDGSDNNDPDVGVRRQGFVSLASQSIDSAKDFAIATLLWDTELGRNMGSQVNAVSDYGGNTLHGNLYGFFTNSRLNARNFFDYSGEDPFTRTQAGFTLGGPIRRDRTHFFLSYEHQCFKASSEQHFSTPTFAERRFNQVQNFNSPTGQFGAGIFATTTIFGPFQGVTPLGANILSFYPLPNNPGGPYGVNTLTQVLPADGRGDGFSFRMMQTWGRSLFSARYNFTNDKRTLPSVNRAIRSTLDALTRSQNISLVLDSPLSPNLFSQARFSFGRTVLNFDQYPGNPFVFSATSTGTVQTPSGNQPFTSQTGPLGELIIEPFSPVGIGVETFPQYRASNTFQYADTLTLSLSGHSIKFGGNVRRYRLNSRLDRYYRPQAVYAGGIAYLDGTNPVLIPGVELAAIGPASSLLQTITASTPDSTLGLRFTEYHVFVNDNWRVRPRFTIDAGLRYEFNTVPREVNRRIENALALDNLPSPGASSFDTPARTAAYNEAVDAYSKIVDGRGRMYEPDRNNFGGHLGFAWSLDRAGKTALRGGYGVYYDTILGAVVSQSRNVFPSEIPVNVDPAFLAFSVFNLNNPVFLTIGQDANGNPVTLLRPGTCNQFGTCNQLGGTPADFAALVGQLFLQNTSGGLAFTLPEKNLRSPYAQQWHLTFEREIFDGHYLAIAYVGTKGTKLTRLTTPNLGPFVTPIIPLVPSHGSNANLFPFPIIATSSVTNGFTSVLPNPPGPCPITLPNADPNLPFVCGDTRFSFNSRPNGALGAYRIFESSAASNYHALQLETRKRYSRGFQFTAAYTWSHSIDDVSDLFPIAGAPIVAQNSFDLRSERASSNFDVRHRFSSSLVWDIPYVRGTRGVAALLLSNWQIASLFQANTGQPFTLNLPYDANLDGNLSDRPPSTDGLVFFDGHNRQRVALAPGRQVTDYLSTRVTNGRTQLVFQSGALGRNTVRGDSLINLDLALSKRFRFNEAQVLVFRTEIFNLLNRANFGLPIRVIGAPGFGSSVETITPARMIQFVLKYDF